MTFVVQKAKIELYIVCKKLIAINQNANCQLTRRDNLFA